MKEKCPKCKKTSDEVLIVPSMCGTKRRCIFCGHVWVVKKANKKINKVHKIKTTVSINTEVDLPAVFKKYLADEKTKAIDAIRLLGSAAAQDMRMITFPSSLFASAKNCDNIQLAVIVAYIVNNWDEAYKTSEQWWIKKHAEIAKANEHKTCGTCADWQTCQSTESWRRNSPCSGIGGVKWKKKRAKRKGGTHAS